MAKTITIRVSARTVDALRRGRSVRVGLNRSNVVGGVAWRIGRPAGKNARCPSLWWHTGGRPRAGSLAARLLLSAVEHGGRVDTKQAKRVLRRGRQHTSGVLSHLAAAGLLWRESWGRYVVTAKGKAARAALSEVGRYLEGSHRARVFAWARKRRRPFEVADVVRFLRVGRQSVHMVLRKLVRDRVLTRESLGVYRAR